MAGVVRGIWNEPEGLVMSVATFPGRPEPIAVRGSNPSWVPGVALPALEKLGVPRSLLVPTGVAFRGRPVFAWEGESRQAKVVDILERGTDFDRVTVA